MKDALEEVHRRGAEEAGNEEVGGFVVDFERGVDLLDDAFLESGGGVEHGVHHDDAGAHGHGFDLVVGDVDHGGLETAVQLDDLGAHLDAHLGVEVGERFVEEKDLGLAHDGAADGDALALAAGERLGGAVEELAETEDFGGGEHAALDFVFGGFAQF